MATVESLPSQAWAGVETERELSVVQEDWLCLCPGVAGPN